LKIPEQKF
jgi:hypothetical protein